MNWLLLFIAVGLLNACVGGSKLECLRSDASHTPPCVDGRDWLLAEGEPAYCFMNGNFACQDVPVEGRGFILNPQSFVDNALYHGTEDPGCPVDSTHGMTNAHLVRASFGRAVESFNLSASGAGARVKLTYIESLETSAAGTETEDGSDLVYMSEPTHLFVLGPRQASEVPEFAATHCFGVPEVRECDVAVSPGFFLYDPTDQIPTHDRLVSTGPLKVAAFRLDSDLPDPTPPCSEISLQSVFIHEFGHVVGISDTDLPQSETIMAKGGVTMEDKMTCLDRKALFFLYCEELGEADDCSEMAIASFDCSTGP